MTLREAEKIQQFDKICYLLRRWNSSDLTDRQCAHMIQAVIKSAWITTDGLWDEVEAGLTLKSEMLL